MIFEYKCWDCEEVIEKDYPVGKAAKTVPCPKCQKKVERFYSAANFVLKGGGWPGKSLSMDKEMTQRNEAAGERMKDTWGGSAPKLIPNVDGKPI